jgi:hypothetical protein
MGSVSNLFQCRIREGQITSENGECENQRADLKVAGSGVAMSVSSHGTPTGCPRLGGGYGNRRVISTAEQEVGEKPKTPSGEADFGPPLLFAYCFFMFIGLLFSWQSPECTRDLRFE